jgi:hypothetical protein
MGDCLTIEEANDFLSHDSNRITGRIAKALAINDPYVNVIETGKFRSGISSSQRSVIQEAVAPVLSQVAPQWNDFTCGVPSDTIETGSTEYSYAPLSYSEKGPTICLTDGFNAFEGAIKRTEEAISNHVQTLWTSWVRYQAYVLSASKVVAYSLASGFSEILTEGLGTNFAAGVLPDSPLSFKFVKYIANYLMHVRLASGEYQFGSGMNAHYRLISDQATIDALREEISPNLRAIAANSGTDYGVDALKDYTFDGPYQGIAFGVDQSILRAASIDADGTPNFVEPFITEAATNGVKRAVNPAWLSAPYQVSFLFAKGSFIRQIPEEYLGEGMAKFFEQFWAGDVRWHNIKDNDCNVFGDRGFHIYRLAAAFRPERPEFVVPILHVRCEDDFGLTDCTPQYYATTL